MHVKEEDQCMQRRIMRLYVVGADSMKGTEVASQSEEMQVKSYLDSLGDTGMELLCLSLYSSLVKTPVDASTRP